MDREPGGGRTGRQYVGAGIGIVLDNLALWVRIGEAFLARRDEDDG